MADDAKSARLHAHRNNIRRYRALLETHLTDVERKYIERRLSEELAVLRVAYPEDERVTAEE
jgi:hypothetical protein